jgi:hypothetical protein
MWIESLLGAAGADGLVDALGEVAAGTDGDAEPATGPDGEVEPDGVTEPPGDADAMTDPAGAGVVAAGLTTVVEGAGPPTRVTADALSAVALVRVTSFVPSLKIRTTIGAEAPAG